MLQNRILNLTITAFFACCLIGCEGKQIGARETGALAGGALGAGLGAIVGHKTGETGAGIAIGAAAGAISGGLIGNEIDRQNQALANMDEKLARQEQIIEENKRIIAELKRKGADARMTKRGVVVNLPDVLFEFNKYTLRADALRACHEIANVLRGYPDRHISVEGHTDSVGSIAYNKRLSQERARSVAEELVVQGVSRKRLSTYGYGESDPIASNRSEAGRQRNRRVEVILENR